MIDLDDCIGMQWKEDRKITYVRFAYTSFLPASEEQGICFYFDFSLNIAIVISVLQKNAFSLDDVLCSTVLI